MKQLKGHTKIELTNVKTGEKKVVEEHNLVTNYLEKLLSKQNPLNNYLTYSGWSFIGVNNLFFGLMCFEEPVEENPDNYLFPISNPVTAAGGADIAYDTADLTTGVFVQAKSDTSGVHSRTYVWDFDLDHGNGQISTVSLVPYKCANGMFPHKWDCSQTSNNLNNASLDVYRIAGYSYNSGYYRQCACLGVAATNTFGTGQYRVVYVSFEQKIAVYAQTNSDGKQFLIRHVSLGEDEYNPWTSNLQSDYRRIGRDDANNLDYTKVKDFQSIDISDFAYGGTAGSEPNWCISGHYVYKTAGSQENSNTSGRYWNHNTERKFLRIDVLTGLRDIITVTNTSGKQGHFNPRSGNVNFHDARFVFMIDGDYVLFTTTDYKVAYVNLINNADSGVLQQDTPDGLTDFTLQSWTSKLTFYRAGNKTYINREGEYWDESNYSSYDQYAYIVDMENKMVRKLGVYQDNTRRASSNNNHFNLMGSVYYAETDDDIFLAHLDSEKVNVGFGLNSMVLTTINTLTEPVVKTNEMVMRITYTISEAPDEENAK